MTKLNELVRYYIRNLVNNPDKVSVNELVTESKHIIEVRVAGNDLARVIGKEGKIFRALRNLVLAADPNVKRDILVDVIT